MHKLHRICLFLLAALLLAGLFACKDAGSAGGNVEADRFDFTDFGEDGIPNGWWINSYEGGYKTFAENGAFGMETLGADDIRLCRTVEIEPDTVYVFAAEVRTEQVQDGQGATLSIDNYSIDGCYLYSDPLYGTNDWTAVQLAFRTAKSQEAVMLALRIGGYSSETAGAAWFRNVSLQKTQNAAGTVHNLIPAGAEAEDQEHTVEDYENIFTVIFWLGTIAAIVLAFGFLYRAKLLAAAKNERIGQYWIFPIIVVAGFVIRFILCAKFKGHATDMVCWQAWGSRIVSDGTHGFYVNNWCDYPPGYMLVCGLLYRISSAFEGAPESVRLFVYMTPAFLCDVLSGLLVLTTAKRFRLGSGLALLLAGLIVLNPAAVFLSGAWGQIDSILAVMLIGTFLLFDRSREHAFLRVFAAILYTLAILVKWQALIFGPVLALMFIATGLWTWNRRSFLKHLGFSFAALFAALGVLALALLLFRGEGMEFFWMKDMFLKASSGYDYASVEGYNFLTFFGGNWAPMHRTLADGTEEALPMFAKMNAGEILLKCSELFSRVALLIGFPTLIFRAWDRMRTRKEGERNLAFFELIFAGLFTALLALLRFLAKNVVSDNTVVQTFLGVISDFPLYGLLMVGMFAYIVGTECRRKRLIDWIRDGGASVAGTMTLVLSVIAFFGTWLLAALFKLFGSELTWHVFGVIGIAGAGVVVLGLFTIYLVRHIKARIALYENHGLIFLLAALFMVLVFTFGHYMHERYIFPALFLLAFAYAYDRDPYKLAAFCMLTVTAFMNEMVAMYVVSPGAIDMIRGGELHNRMIDLISLLEVGAALFFTAISFRKALIFDPRDPADEGSPMQADTDTPIGGERNGL